VRCEREMFTEREQQTGVGLSIGQATSTGWRHLQLIPASGPFSRLVKALVTCKWQVLDEECLRKSKFKSTHRMVAVAGWRHLPPISAFGPVSQLEKR
jgi:hypothetical protein